MEILFVIGNGFDINLGMNTRYTDFFNHYQHKNSPNPLVDDLKKSIANDKPNWADFEFAFGKFTEKIGTPEEFDEVFEHIGLHLSEYLESQESLFDVSRVKREDIFKYLCFPEKSLLPADNELVLKFKSHWSSHQWNLDIVTLNYTRTIDRIFWEHNKNARIGNHNQLPIILNGIHHVHGYTDNRMIFGVNDLTQVGNKNFHDNTDVIEALIKNRCNKAQKHNIDIKCTKLIKKANLICIFGSSLGDTDNQWWELIGEQLKREARIIIYTMGEEVIIPRIAHRVGRIERATRARFLSKTNLSDGDKQKFADNIFVAYNSDMFKLIWQP